MVPRKGKLPLSTPFERSMGEFLRSPPKIFQLVKVCCDPANGVRRPAEEA
jgi:hypothetical protein